MKQIVVVGGDLFRIALTEYGDATAYLGILEANPQLGGDYVIAGPVVLTIPDYDTSFSDGVPNQ